MSALYPLWKQELLQLNAANTTNLSSSVTTRVVLLTSAYSYNAANQYYASVMSAVVGSPSTGLTTKTFVGGTFKADTVTFTAVTAGSTVTALAIYNDTGSTSTSPLVAYIDGFTPVTTNGGNITISWNASGIFTL